MDYPGGPVNLVRQILEKDQEFTVIRLEPLTMSADSHCTYSSQLFYYINMERKSMRSLDRTLGDFRFVLSRSSLASVRISIYRHFLEPFEKKRASTS